MQKERELKSKLRKLLKIGIEAAEENDMYGTIKAGQEICHYLAELRKYYAERNTFISPRKTKRSG